MGQLIIGYKLLSVRAGVPGNRYEVARKENFNCYLTRSIHIRQHKHVESNLRGGISNLQIFDINLFQYGGKSNLVGPDLPALDARPRIFA